MPTVLFMLGWRLFFYSDEGDEPPHIHARKGDAECKYWILEEAFDIREEWAYNLTPRLRREIRKIILTNFDLILTAWNEHLGKHRNENS